MSVEALINLPLKYRLLLTPSPLPDGALLHIPPNGSIEAGIGSLKGGGGGGIPWHKTISTPHLLELNKVLDVTLVVLVVEALNALPDLTRFLSQLF